MPKYTFRCLDCLFVWDGRVPTSKIPPDFECPRCKQKDIEKALPSSLSRKKETKKRPGDLLKKTIREMKEELKHDSYTSYDDLD